MPEKEEVAQLHTNILYAWAELKNTTPESLPLYKIFPQLR